MKNDPKKCPLCWANLKAIQKTAIETEDYLLIAIAVGLPCPHTRREKRNASIRLKKESADGYSAQSAYEEPESGQIHPLYEED
jgi:predicted metal-binding protein